MMLEYQLSSAANYAQSSPCTNRPIQCPQCPAVIWSYSMADHFAKKHGATPMPADLVQATSLRFHEKAGTSALLNVYPKSLKKICNGPSCQCKKTPNAPAANV